MVRSNLLPLRASLEGNTKFATGPPELPGHHGKTQGTARRIGRRGKGESSISGVLLDRIGDAILGGDGVAILHPENLGEADTGLHRSNHFGRVFGRRSKRCRVKANNLLDIV